MNSKQITADAGSLRWFKSSYSGSDGGDCVEVAPAQGTVHVRDSKDRQGPVLGFSDAEWSAFVAYARTAQGADL
ncbi:DUF397 domain-containing protein [Streptomyces sp. NPDC003720]|uniref:DUF397 domain-containing protein n=1 Tax=Streptomyces sp. NPDC003720 TaxID=3364684 RepID=UPI0036AE0683